MYVPSVLDFEETENVCAHEVEEVDEAKRIERLAAKHPREMIAKAFEFVSEDLLGGTKC